MKAVFCFIALAISCYAHAVNITWTQFADGATSAGKVADRNKVYVIANTSATVAAAITYGGSIGTGTVLSFGGWASSQASFSVGIDENGHYTLTTNRPVNGVSSTNNISAVAGETQILGLSIYRNSGTNMSKIELSVNGEVAASLTNVSLSSGYLERIAWGMDIYDKNAYTGEAEYDVWYSDETSGASYALDAATIESEVAALLPEPTALTLLALGVAGLALKRKVA